MLWKILGGMFVCFVMLSLLFPWITNRVITANFRAVGSKGRDIVVAIKGANKSRATQGLPPLWPKTYLSYTNRLDDISGKIFQTSSDYFYELYDGRNVGSDQHHPYIKGFDYGKLAGGGVPAKSGQGNLVAANNMWIIAANITDEDDDRIPLLITRNVDAKEIEKVFNQGLKVNEFEKRLAFSETYLSPFGNKQIVFVCKSGKFRIVNPNRRTLGALFYGKELPPRDPSKPPIVYLMP
ncbi:MAG: hypothetical protein WCJ02_03280 [bacterium]